MNILITGGHGFIGSQVAERLNKEGHKIFVIDNHSTGTAKNLIMKHKFYKIDIQSRECEDIFSINKFDVVVHLAAQISASASLNDPLTDTSSNILGLVNMLYLSAKYGVKKIYICFLSCRVWEHRPAAYYGGSRNQSTVSIWNEQDDW